MGDRRSIQQRENDAVEIISAIQAQNRQDEIGQFFAGIDLDNFSEGIIQAIQRFLSSLGFYATDERHGFYADGLMGESTLHGIRLAEGGYDYAQAHLGDALGDNSLSRSKIANIQADLHSMGYGELVGDVDGLFGPLTANAVAQALRDHPEYLDELGPQAAAYLNTYLSADELRDIYQDNENALTQMESAGTVRATTSRSLAGFDIDNLPAGTNPLTALITQAESRGDYNIVYNGTGSGGHVNLTSMTINEVLDWQRSHVRQGHASSAAGAFQIIRPTLQGLRDELGLSGNERFDEDMQDRLGHALMVRRGLYDFVEGRISEDEFAYQMSQEWAALPRDESGRSYYAGDGLNTAHVGYDQFVQAATTYRNQVTEERSAVASAAPSIDSAPALTS